MEKKTPRVAFIIQCHKNPEQVNLLTDSLKKIYDCHVFLHVDKKSAAIRERIDTRDLTLLPEEACVDVRWSKFSQCEATLALMEAVLASGQEFDYVWLISGQDLPIAGGDRLPLPAQPFIEVMGPENSMYRTFSKRNDIYYPEWLMERGRKDDLMRMVYQRLTGGVKQTWKPFRRKLGVPYYFGSSWWCLPYGCVKEMMELYHGSGNYERYFRNAINSDESFFQTLFMQTAWAGQQRPIPVYIDWSQGLASPRTFTMEETAALAEAGKRNLLARKFDLAVDEPVCHWVLTELCGLSE